MVETNIHHPTDSSLLGDGVRVLIRVMKKVNEVAEGAGTQLRDRSRSVKLRVVEIARVSRSKSQQGQERMKQLYEKSLDASGRVAGQARQFVQEIADGVKQSSDVLKQAALQGMKRELETMLERVKQVRRQTRERVFGGDTHVEGKLASIFEPTTEIIRRGKASKPTEFGKMIKIQEAENQIITHFEVYPTRPTGSALLEPAIQIHKERLGRAPDLATGDAAFYSIAGEKAAQELGVTHVAVPNRKTKSVERRKLEKQRWFKQGQKWRTGCEGRISVLKRRHGLNRCRYKGDLFALDADCAEALWALDQPAGRLDRHAMLRDTLAALNHLPPAAARFRKKLPPGSQPVLAQLERSVRKALNPREAYNMVPGRDPENV